MSEFLFDWRRGDHRLETVQDTLAHAFDVPIQTICLAQVRKLQDRWPCDPNNTPLFSSPAAFNSFATEVAQGPEGGMRRFFSGTPTVDAWRRALDPNHGLDWLTKPSYANPMIRLFRGHWAWRWWELTWLWSKAVGHANRSHPGSEVEIWHYGDMLGRRFALAATPVPGADAMVVLGPSWIWPLEHGPQGESRSEDAGRGDWNGTAFKGNAVKRFIELVEGLSNEPAAKAVPSPKWTQPLYRSGRLRRMAGIRSAGTLRDFVQRCRFVATAMEYLARFKRRDIQTTAYLVGLTEVVAFLGSETTYLDPAQQSSAREAELIGVRPAFNLLSPLPSLYWDIGSICEPHPQGEAHPALRVGPSSLQLEFVPKSIEERPQQDTRGHAGTWQPIRWCADHQTISDHDAGMFMAAITQKFSQFLDGTQTRRNGNILENFLLLRIWLQDRFGIGIRASEAADGLKPGDRQIEPTGRRAARRAANIFNADVAVIYRYDYCTESLQALGTHVSTYFEPCQDIAKRWKDTMADFMAKAGRDHSQRTQSLCYRCIDCADEWDIEYVESFSPETGLTVPAGKALLLPPEGFKSGRNGVAAPITYLGRRWGVVELLGAEGFQFRRIDHRAIGELARVFSAYFYQQDMITHLSRIGEIAASSQGIAEKQTEICRCLAQIFLVESVSLFVKHKTMGNIYHCEAWVNRADYDREADAKKII